MKKPDPLRNNPEARMRRDRRHKHNGFKGSVAMAKANMNSIIKSQTATQDARHLAAVVLQSLVILDRLLDTRID